MKLTILFFFIGIGAFAQTNVPKPFGAVPSERQLEWHKLKYYAFIHFGPNTFTNDEWGYGDKSPKVFNPSELDCRQWAKTAKDAGMEGIVITAKHHDGFCLWPTETTEYSVKKSPWKNGQGDLIKDLREACDEFGLKLGIYISPWDRNSALYGTPEYLDIYREQISELLGGYGEVYEFWADGANGGDGYYGGANETRRIDNKTYYNWSTTHEMIRKLQPNAVMFSDAGPDIRWVGNEGGYATDPNWCTVDTTILKFGSSGLNDKLQTGWEDGNKWLPAEVNTSIRPGWFYHASEDKAVKSLNQLIDNWYSSVGMNGNFILNLPPDKRGLIHENDVKRLNDLKAYVDKAFSINYAKGASVSASNYRGKSADFSPEKTIDNNPESYWATEDHIKTASIEISFEKEIPVNCVLLQEYIRLGQRVKGFSVQALIEGEFVEVTNGITIGNRRLAKFKTVNTKKLRVDFEGKASLCISNIEVYRVPEMIGTPKIIRNKQGYVRIVTDSPDPVFYYTIDGTEPTLKSQQFTKPFYFPKPGIIKAISHLPTDQQTSETVSAELDITSAKWKIYRSCDDYYSSYYPVENMIDGNPATSWFSDRDGKQLPCEITLDLGELVALKGFNYLPRQDGKSNGNIYRYNLQISKDGKKWDTVFENKEFSNIGNNPILQKVLFANSIDAKYLKLEVLGDILGENQIAVAELGVITKSNQ